MFLQRSEKIAMNSKINREINYDGSLMKDNSETTDTTNAPFYLVTFINERVPVQSAMWLAQQQQQVVRIPILHLVHVVKSRPD